MATIRRTPLLVAVVVLLGVAAFLADTVLFHTEGEDVGNAVTTSLVVVLIGFVALAVRARRRHGSGG